VHRWRAQQERTARRALAGALAALGQVEHSLARVRGGIAACRGEERGAARALAHAVEQGLGRSAVALEARRAAAAAALERARAEYAERRRDQRATLRLYETRRAAWRAAAQAEEQREAEEMARLRWPLRKEARP
jgi:hypothetical protein